ncbi:hypothetical protein FQR65_LT17576 [Abscondita terminalis]|nr:hypothetical protein FQR65_LT17576 [Abscondita terminalis]
MLAAHPMAGNRIFQVRAAVPNLFKDKMMDSITEQLEMKTSYIMPMNMMYTRHMYPIFHTSLLLLLHSRYWEKKNHRGVCFETCRFGFESTVRLAKSSPDMWTPIFKQNRANVLEVLDEHIKQLQLLHQAIEKEDYDELIVLQRFPDFAALSALYKREQNLSPMQKDQPVCISLTAAQSHKITIPAGQGSFSIGTKGISKGKYDTWVEKGEVIQWNCFDEFSTPAGSRWPRFLYYAGNDNGFVEWSDQRPVEDFHWFPYESVSADLTKADIGKFSCSFIRRTGRINIGKQDQKTLSVRQSGTVSR